MKEAADFVVRYVVLDHKMRYSGPSALLLPPTLFPALYVINEEQLGSFYEVPNLLYWQCLTAVTHISPFVTSRGVNHYRIMNV